MAKKFPLHPKHPERICWGCDKYCSTDSLACGNGSGRTQHPAEILGDDWYEHGDWGLDVDEPVKDPSVTPPDVSDATESDKSPSANLGMEFQKAVAGPHVGRWEAQQPEWQLNDSSANANLPQGGGKQG